MELLGKESEDNVGKITIIRELEKVVKNNLTVGYEGFSFEAWDSNIEEDIEGTGVFCESGLLVFSTNTESTFVANVSTVSFEEMILFLEKETCFEKVKLIEKLTKINIVLDTCIN